MLSIGRLGVATGAEYYLETVANSVDDYYLGHGEAPGRWIGATAEQLGLTGEVRPVAHGEERLRELVKLGYKRVILPRDNLPRTAPAGVALHAVASLGEALAAAFD